MDKAFKETVEKDLANKMYQPSDYQSQNEMDQGMAVTHEQVSDTYVEGSIEAIIENYQGTGKDHKISNENH